MTRHANQLELRRKFCRCLTCLVVLLAGTPLCQPAYGVSLFSSGLDIDVTVPGGAIYNTFGFATWYPKPARAGAKNPDGSFDVTKAIGNGGAAGAYRADRAKATKGNGLSLEVRGTTAAFPDGEWAAEAWATGRTRLRLGNFTGRLPQFPPGQNVTVDVHVNATPTLHAEATPDIAYDWAQAKYFYTLIDADTGTEFFPSMTTAVEVAEGQPPATYGPILESTIIPVTIPKNSFMNLDLTAHVFASGYSKAALPPVVVPPPALTPIRERANTLFPDPGMMVSASETGLLGDAVSDGAWLLADVGGVQGNDPLAAFGLPTVFLTQVALQPQHPHDIEISVEAPFNGETIVALDNLLIMPGGTHGFGQQLQLGLGAGDDFAPADPSLPLHFLGPDQGFVPEERTGNMQFAGADNPFAPTSLLFQGDLHSGQQAQFLTQIAVHDAIDGQLDGMVRFTLREAMQGMAGDFNGDFLVDNQDYDLWKELYGSADMLADANLDGVVGPADYTLFADSLRQGGVLLSKTGFPVSDLADLARTAAAVPEPAAAVMLLSLLLSGSGVRRRTGNGGTAGRSVTG